MGKQHKKQSIQNTTALRYYLLYVKFAMVCWCCWYSVISSGDDEGNISELTVCWKLELLGSQEITAEVEVMLAAWR